VDNFDRNHARAIISEIVSYNPETFFKIVYGGLEVGPRSGLCDEQRFLIKAHRDEIIQYLTTPPDVIGECLHGHERKWKCSPHGTWLCECYFGPYDAKKYQASGKKGIRNYWMDIALAN